MAANPPINAAYKAIISRVIDGDKTQLRNDMQNLTQQEKRDFLAHLQTSIRVLELVMEIEFIQNNNAKDM